MTMRTPEGQPYIPDVVDLIVQRYQFKQYPTTFEEFSSEPIQFGMGKWNGVDIMNLSSFSDGISVESITTTEILDTFMDDLLSALEDRFNLKLVPLSTNGKFYESNLVVEMGESIQKKLEFIETINSKISKQQSEYGAGDYEYDFAALTTAPDPTVYSGKKPIPFSIVRRANLPFDDNAWYSTAPLKTKDHIELLEGLEIIMS